MVMSLISGRNQTVLSIAGKVRLQAHLIHALVEDPSQDRKAQADACRMTI
jgi:hypothetical protein